MAKVLVLDVVGLTRHQIGTATPNLAALAARGSCAPLEPLLPALTCSAQATLLTGVLPETHGAVGNGWMMRSTREVALWRQANSLVEAPKVYDVARARNPRFTCAKLFWWWNLGADVDWSITPRPYYPADGRKIPAVYAWPPEYGERLTGALGDFPFFDFWGPKAGLPSSRWIADAAIATLRGERPDLTLAYLPHLDYDHQRFGPDDPRSRKALAQVDGLVGDLVAAADAEGVETVVVSEYGIGPVSRPVHVNRALREAGLLVARPTPAGEVLDPFASRAFAVADHQIAHVYTRDARALDEARAVLEPLAGVAQVLGDEGKQHHGVAHPNAGDLFLVADPDAWFTYYYWTDPAAEPDFARTVDIHRKPGYDPCEMFLDPALRAPKLRVAWRLLQKKVGQRMLMDVIPIAPELVRGSHGWLPPSPDRGPVWLSSRPFGEHNPEPGADGCVPATSVQGRLLALLELA